MKNLFETLGKMADALVEELTESAEAVNDSIKSTGLEEALDRHTKNLQKEVEKLQRSKTVANLTSYVESILNEFAPDAQDCSDQGCSQSDCCKEAPPIKEESVCTAKAMALSVLQNEALVKDAREKQRNGEDVSNHPVTVAINLLQGK